MNKRNELRAKLQARHNEHHQQQQQLRSGGGGGPSSVLPKAKRPAAVAALSATVPKKQKLEHHKFNYQQKHHFAQHQIASSSSLAFSDQQQQQQQNHYRQQQSLLLVREAAECAASAVDDAAGDVIIEECGGGGVGGIVPLANLTQKDTLRNQTSSMTADSTSQRSGAEDEPQQAVNIRAMSSVDGWIYSADGRQIDDAIAELSLDKAFQLLGTASTDQSAEAVARLIAFVSENIDLISADQAQSLFLALRANRLRGIDGAEKLLLLLLHRQQRCADTAAVVTEFSSKSMRHSSFSRPPPTSTATLSASMANKTSPNSSDNAVVTDLAQQTVLENATNDSDIVTHLCASKFIGERLQRKQCLANKSADELLELLLSSSDVKKDAVEAVSDEQHTHSIVTELLDKRPDLLDVNAPNFDAQLIALFSSRKSVARSLICHQLALCSSATVIKKTVPLLLDCFNPSFSPASVVTFMAKVCAEDAKVSVLLNGAQCFVLALYVLEDIEHNYTPGMAEKALNALDTVRLFGSVLANILRRQLQGLSSELALTDQSSSVVVPSSSSDLLETFTRHYHAYMDKLRHANVATSFFSPSGSGLVRRRHCLNMLYQTVCHNFPVVPSKCLFLGMFAKYTGGPAHQTTTKTHITRAKFDRLITGAIREIFDLIIKVGKGGPEVDLALEKAHQLVHHFRNCQDVQLSRYMPLLSTKMQNLVDSLACREIKNSPHCALLLSSLDLTIVALRNSGSYSNNDDDDDDEEGAEGDAGTPPLLQTVSIALQALLRLLQQNRRNRQIQSLCEKLCNAVVQLLKFSNSRASVGGAFDSQRYDSIRQLFFSSNGVLLGELADWKALNVPDRAMLKRAVAATAAAQIESTNGTS